MCEITGIELAREEFAGLPISREAVFEAIIREVCNLTGVQYKEPADSITCKRSYTWVRVAAACCTVCVSVRVGLSLLRVVAMRGGRS